MGKVAAGFFVGFLALWAAMVLPPFFSSDIDNAFVNGLVWISRQLIIVTAIIGDALLSDVGRVDNQKSIVNLGAALTGAIALLAKSYRDGTGNRWKLLVPAAMFALLYGLYSAAFSDWPLNLKDRLDAVFYSLDLSAGGTAGRSTSFFNVLDALRLTFLAAAIASFRPLLAKRTNATPTPAGQDQQDGDGNGTA